MNNEASFFSLPDQKVLKILAESSDDKNNITSNHYLAKTKETMNI